MKKLISLAIIYLTLFLFGESCNTQTYLITDINLFSAVYDDNETTDEFSKYSKSTILSNGFALWIEYETQLISENYNLSPNACYAFTKAEKFDNELIESTFSVKFSDDFIYNGDMIKKETNLLNSSFSNEIQI